MKFAIIIPQVIKVVILFVFLLLTFSVSQASYLINGGLGINNERVPISETRPQTVNTMLGRLDIHTEFGVTYDIFYDNRTGNFVAVGGRSRSDSGPTNRDPRDYERWRVIGDIGFWGSGYDYRNTPCTGAPGEDKSRCNNSCIALSFWSCDTREHLQGNRVEVIVDGNVSDTIMPVGSWQGLTDNSWANRSRYDYTPNCGSSPEYMYYFRYPTPVAWKDGQTRVIRLRSTVASTTINNMFYRSNNGSSLGPILTNAQLAIYGLVDSPSINYRLMYTDSVAPTTDLLPNAGWDEANKDGDSNDIIEFPITCPVLPNLQIDLTGQLLDIRDQVVSVPYTVRGNVRNVGTAPASTSIPVRLDFDFNRNGFTNGSGGDFTVNTTRGALAAGASGLAVFSGITHSQLGQWQVRMRVDPDSVVETDIDSRQNNASPWVPFSVTRAIGATYLDLFASSPVSVGENITLAWMSANIQNGSCVATGAWAGARNEVGFTTVPATAVGTYIFTLNCITTSGNPISDTATVQVIGTTPDLVFSSISYNTCTPAQQNQATGACPNTTVSLVIRNQGVAIPSSELIPYRLEKSVASLWVEIPGASGTLAGLGAGSLSSVINLNAPNLQAGVPQRFRARVNLPNTNIDIGETRFGNNSTTTPFFTIPAIPPDYLVFSATTATCPATGAQNLITGICPSSQVRFVIENTEANTPAGVRIPYTVERNISGTWTVVPLGADDIPPLAAGVRSSPETVTISNLPVGSHNFRIHVNNPLEPDLFEAVTGNNISNTLTITVPSLPPQCSNRSDDADPEDTLIDILDPGCLIDPFGLSTIANFNPLDDDERNSTIVLTPPDITLTATPPLVRFGAKASVRYSIESTYSLSCTLSGIGPIRTINYTAPAPLVATIESLPLRGTQRITLNCSPAGTIPGLNPLPTSETATVEVVPQAYES